MRTLKNLADFSSISVELSSKRVEQFSSEELLNLLVFLGFWIFHHLKALYVGERLELENIEGLVVLNKKRGLCCRIC